MKKNTCVLCNSSDFERLFSVHGRILEKCSECSLVRTHSFVLPNYDKYHRDNEYKDSEVFFKNIFKSRYQQIARHVKHIGRVLDVGSSNGAFLDIFRSSGWATIGVEPSGSYAIGKEKGHTVYHSTLERVKFEDESFDVVVANHVLEHIPNPNPFLSRCRDLLKKNGVLYIDVPNFGSLSSKLAGKDWKYILPTEHVHHFTEETLTKLLVKNGFRIINIKTRSGIFEAANPVRYLFDELFHLKKNFFFDIFGIPGNIIALILNSGTSIGVVAIKHEQS